MVAPIVPVIVGVVSYLVGAATPVAVGAVYLLEKANPAEAVAAHVYADLPAICALADPLIDAAQDAADEKAQGRATFWRRLADDTAAGVDAACLAARTGKNSPLGQLRVATSAVAAITKAEEALSALPGPRTAPSAPRPGRRPPLWRRAADWLGPHWRGRSL